MGRKPICPFGVTAKTRLIEINQSQAWLIDRLKEDTGLYVDNGLLQRVWRGEYKSPALISGICKILELDEPTQNTV